LILLRRWSLWIILASTLREALDLSLEAHLIPLFMAR
jgi:hypothetical protein